MNEYDIQQLPYSELTKCMNPHILIYGKRGSGKSWTVQCLLQNMNIAEENMFIFSPPDEFDPFYKRHFSSSNMFYKYDNMKLEEIMINQINKKYVIIRNKTCSEIDSEPKIDQKSNLCCS